MTILNAASVNLRSRGNNSHPINIGVMEGSINGKEDAIVMPSRMWGAFGAKPSDHAERVVRVMRRYLPDAEKCRIHIIYPTQASVQYCIDNNIKIVNMSLAASRMGISAERELAKHAFLITSGGNAGEKGETAAARLEHWMAVGAVDRDLKLRRYSSHGLGHIKCVAHDWIGTGTSFAAPVVAALLAQWYAWFEHHTGTYPNVRQTNNYIQENCLDIDLDGLDAKTGWGYFRNAWRWEATKVILTNDSTKAKRITIQQDMNRRVVQTEENIDLHIAPRIENNRTLVGSRDASELFGLNVVWDRSRPQESVYVR